MTSLHYLHYLHCKPKRANVWHVKTRICAKNIDFMVSGGKLLNFSPNKPLDKLVKYSFGPLPYKKNILSVKLHKIYLNRKTYLFLASRLLTEVRIGLNLIIYLLLFYYFTVCKNYFCKQIDVSVALMGL